MATCACGDRWLVEVADLATGRVRGVIHPVSMDWETRLNDPGQGTLTLPTKDVLIRDVWPHLSSVWISRVAGGSATTLNPVPEFGGLIESVRASDTGTTEVGFHSIEQYLWHRNIRSRQNFAGVSQTVIGQRLVNLARTQGIPLRAVADASRYERDRTYDPWNRKPIGEALADMSEVINGFDWEMVHTRTRGDWSSEMIFRDYVGEDRGVIVQSDRESAGYELDIDAKDHATLVDAIGSGEEEDQLIATAQDTSRIYPQFDATPAWKDVSRMNTLQSHADGYLSTYREPPATPSFTIRGLDPDPRDIRIGDTVHVRTDFGAVTYHGDGRVVGISWRIGDAADSRTYDLVPITRASQSVLNQIPRDTCERC